MLREAHRAFGLTIAADFALPGMVPADHGPTDLTIRVGSRQDVEAAWAAREPATAWRSMFGDGRIFSGERAADGSWRLAYGHDALFFVSADAGTVLCGPEDPQDAAWQRVLLDAVLMVASVAAGYEVLHAGRVRRREEQPGRRARAPRVSPLLRRHPRARPWPARGALAPRSAGDERPAVSRALPGGGDRLGARDVR
jgi:hypothetical protein